MRVRLTACVSADLHAAVEELGPGDVSALVVVEHVVELLDLAARAAANFTRLVLGCIEAKFGKKICV